MAGQIEIVITEEFKKSFTKLPKKIKKKLDSSSLKGVVLAHPISSISLIQITFNKNPGNAPRGFFKWSGFTLSGDNDKIKTIRQEFFNSLSIAGT